MRHNTLFKSSTQSGLSMGLIVLCLLVVPFWGCGEKAVYSKSVADLNAKAKTMIDQGNPDGAISRLESALDLNPDEPTTLYNLGIAYHTKGDYDKAIATFEKLVEGKKMDESQARQSLGLSYEAKADELMGKLSDEKPPANADELKTEAKGYYEKALATLSEVKPGPQQNPVKLQGHLDQLRETISKLG